MSRISQEELERYLWSSAVLLRTHIDAGAYKQYIFPLLFFKRICDVYDEECAQILKEYDGDTEALNFEENHRFIVPQGAHWQDVRSVSENVGVAIVKALRAIEKANIDKLQGVFGNAAWTNKKRLSDELLKDLIEHFSSKTLSIANCPEDELGQGYEYLIKQFADDSGHTAQEFCIAYLQHKQQEWRNVKIFGQEITQLTAAIAKMNLFLHGIKDFNIINDDTLKNPGFVEKGKLKTFDLVLANPPYSIKQWDRAAFEADKWGRNILGTPPQGRADYAFFQHIIKSMDEKNGRCAILFPHGVLFRQEEKDLREKLVKMDILDCVIGLAPNLFYNSPMEACIVICRMRKEPQKAGKVLFINAINEVTRKNAQSFLEESHINKIASAYENYQDIDGFAKVATIKDIADNNYSLSIPLYARETSNSAVAAETSFVEMCDLWKKTSEEMRLDYQELENMLGAEA